MISFFLDLRKHNAWYPGILIIIPVNMALWLKTTTAFFFFFLISSVHTVKWSLNLQSDQEKEEAMSHSTYL